MYRMSRENEEKKGLPTFKPVHFIDSNLVRFARELCSIILPPFSPATNTTNKVPSITE